MTTLSGSSLPFVKGFDDYVSRASAHDQDRPGGPSARVEYMSTLGDCKPETYVGDVLRTRLAYGKGDLEIDAYSYVLSHSHEELDPADDDLGAVAHGLARSWAQEAWPGRQVKVVTQRDNGRFEGEGDDKTWIDGHWHSHIIVANVAEEPVTLRWTDEKGTEKTKAYPAGRAIDGDLKNIFRLRHVTDDVVMREWQYDNAAYVEACRKFADGAVAKQDLAQRAERGYSTYDEVRLKLRTAASQATDWDDYVARCQAAAVDVRVRGKAGVSYSWIGDDGLDRKAKARGTGGLGAAFTKGEIEGQCAENAAILARGEELVVPEQTLVVPTSTVAPDRPRPVYLTADGKPPWEADEEAFLDRVRQTGGTFEGKALRATALPRREPDVALVRADDGAVVATVQTESGPLVMDVEPEYRQVLGEALATARAQREAEAQEISAGLDGREAAVAELRRAAEAEKADAFRAGYGEGLRSGRSDAEAQAETIVADARTEAAGITDAATAQAQETARLQAERLEREEAEARTAADERVRAYEAAELAKVPPVDLDAFRDQLDARIVDQLDRMKVPDVEESADGKLVRRTDDQGAVVWGRPLEVAAKQADITDRRLNRAADTRTYGERRGAAVQQAKDLQASADSATHRQSRSRDKGMGR